MQRHESCGRVSQSALQDVLKVAVLSRRGLPCSAGALCFLAHLGTLWGATSDISSHPAYQGMMSRPGGRARVYGGAPQAVPKQG